MENNKIKVRIYGQEYTIIGEREKEEIEKIASYVDERMHFIAQNSSIGSTSSLAVLSAVNLADELFSHENELKELREANERLSSDNEKYVELWDEAKRNVIDYKNEVEELKIKADDDSQYKELEAKYKELEESFFELQMENIQLKSDLSKRRKYE